MGGGYFSNAGVFLVNVVFGLYIFAVMLRLALQLVRADFYNPLCQAIVKITNPPLRPMRRVIPAIGRVDTSSVLLLLVLQMLNTGLVAVMLGVSPALAGLLVMAIAELTSKLIWLFIGAIFIQIIISWIGQGGYNPIMGVIDDLTAPLMRPARRIIQPIGGIDLSPMLVLVGLQLALMLIVHPLRDFGAGLL